MNLAAWFSSPWKNGWLVHSVRSAIAATVSLAVARLLKMPEAYWAPLTTIVVMQSTLGGAWAVSIHRLIGTAVGAFFGGLLASYVTLDVMGFGLAIFALGLICGLAHLNQSAYRFAGITLAIVTLVGRGKPPWIVATHRFIEVSVGIAVGLALSALWPQKELAARNS
jgi:uncharacterized membrane protein YccC